MWQYFTTVFWNFFLRWIQVHSNILIFHGQAIFDTVKHIFETDKILCLINWENMPCNISIYHKRGLYFSTIFQVSNSHFIISISHLNLLLPPYSPFSMKSKNLLKALLKHKLGLSCEHEGQAEGNHLASLGNSWLLLVLNLPGFILCCI